MSDEDDWPVFTKLNLRPILKSLDAMVSETAAELTGIPSWDMRELGDTP